MGAGAKQESYEEHVRTTMNFSHPPTIIIIDKNKNVNSSILSNFVKSNNDESSSAQNSNNVNSTNVSSPSKEVKPYSPYMPVVMKASKNFENNINKPFVPNKPKDEIIYSEEPVDDNIELNIFKHKEVNSLIRNRILALESSVVSKTPEKKPLLEVNKVVEELVQVQNDEPFIEQIKAAREEKVELPSSRIRQLAQAMQKEKRPVLEIPIKKITEQSTSEESDTEESSISSEDSESSDEESCSESESNDKDVENIPIIKAITSQSFLKDPTPATKSKDEIPQQYTFDMNKMFHEEKNDEGWQEVKNIESLTSSSSSSAESVSSTDTLVETNPDYKEENFLPAPSKDTSKSVVPLKENLNKLLDPETVDRILLYGQVHGSPIQESYPSFEEYLRYRAGKPGYDSDISNDLSEYESDASFNKFAHDADDESFRNIDYSFGPKEWNLHDEYSDEYSNFSQEYDSQSEFSQNYGELDGQIDPYPYTKGDELAYDNLYKNGDRDGYSHSHPYSEYYDDVQSERSESYSVFSDDQSSLLAGYNSEYFNQDPFDDKRSFYQDERLNSGST